MTQTHKFLSFAALFAAGALTIGCNSLKEELIIPEETPAPDKTITPPSGWTPPPRPWTLPARRPLP